MFEKILEKLFSYKHLPSGEADAAKLEFSNFLSTTVKEKKDSFVKFDKELIASIPLFGSFSLIPTNLLLRKVIKMLILSHGQPTVERGFSGNGKLLVENFHMESLIAQRHPPSHAEL